MRKRLMAWVLAIALLSGAIPVQAYAANLPVEGKAVQAEAEEGREKLNFNQGWKFVRRSIPEAVDVDYDRTELERWENVDLPHSVRLEEYNNSGGKNYQGPAMYRKHFYLPESYEKKKLFIEFEGVMGVTDVWVNGQHMQGHMAEKTGDNTQYGGYLPFVLDVTEAVHCNGEANVIVVLTDNSDNINVPPGKPQGELDFTYFGGIYRNVWLSSVNSVHITDEVYEDEAAGGGILVDFPRVSGEEAVADVLTHVRNEENVNKNVLVETNIVNRDGIIVGTGTEEMMIDAKSASAVRQSIIIDNPNLWNLDNPYMHTLVSRILVDGKETDRVETPVGIRKITMDKESGVLINGKHTGFLSGVNRHQEYPYIGYAASASLQRRDAIKYKSAGFNIVRTAHHPQSEDFLKACDELGILVVDTISGWQHWSDDEVFGERVKNDTRQMIRRDRNHPCILTYEISLNESPGVPAGFTNELEGIAKEEHPSVLTSAENPHQGAAGDMLYGTPGEVASWSDTALSFIREYGDFWEEQFGTFENSCRVTRGEGGFYPGGEGRMVVQANNRLWKGYNFKGTGATSLSEAIQYYQDSDHRFAGATMWIGIDHNRGYHETMSPCGLWDLMRIPKYSYYAFASQRPSERDEYLESQDVETGPLLFVASSWSEKAPALDKTNNETLGTDEKRTIYVYSNAEKVKLSIMGADGNTLWEKEESPITEETASNLDNPPFCFGEVPYTKDSWLKAEGYDSEGKVIAEQEVHTARKPAGIRLEVDDSGAALTADGSDKVMVYAYIVDKNGNVCQNADNKLQFFTEGEGTVAGDGNKRIGANPVKAEAGVTGVYIQSSRKAGAIQVEAVSDGLEGASIEIQSEELMDKTVTYEEIAQGTPIDQVSMYLTQREETLPGEDAPGIVKGNVNAGGAEYPNSMEVKNMAPVSYDIGGDYERLTGKVSVKNPDKAGDGVTFRIYGDGTLKYVSDPITDQTADIDIDITGVEKLTLCAGDEKGINEVIPCWLSFYITEGKGNVDESELKENLAEGSEITATSADGDASPEYAVDGDILTLWRSAGDVTEVNKEALTVDLGKSCDIRNARVAVEHDYLKCTYTIYTSSDQQNWEKQVTASKTAHGNEILDRFSALDVRYVMVEFTKVESTQGETGGSRPRASVKELELYQDKGVDTVKDYNLSGLSVAGHDVLFRPEQTKYEIDIKGNEKDFWVKVFPANIQSAVTINTMQVDINRAESMEETDYMKITPENGNAILIEVVSPDGNGHKQYEIQINQEKRQKRYDALQSFVPGVNGANQWSYQRMDKESGEIFDLDNNMAGFIAGEYAWSGGGGWLYAGPRYMHPSVDSNAVRTFEAPEEGHLIVKAAAGKYINQPGQTALKILKNGEKVWPASKDEEIIEEGKILHLKTTNQVEKGDRIQIVLDSYGDNGGDATYIESCAEYTMGSGEENVDYLSDLEWETAEAGYGTVNRDMSSEGHQICLTDENQKPVVYEKGIGTHAQSRIVYDVKGKGYTRFKSVVGIDYSQYPGGTGASVNFKVYFNDESSNPVYESGEMGCGTPGKVLDISIDGTVEKLILVAEQGENNWSDHADWADARFLTEYKVVDKTELNALIEQAEAIDLNGYQDTEGDDFASFKGILAQAKSLQKDDNASQEAVDSICRDLKLAMDSLVENTSASRLELLIQKAEELLQLADQYTPVSVEKLRVALENAIAVNDNTEGTDEQKNEAYEELAQAMTALVRKGNKEELKNALDKANEIMSNSGKYLAESIAGLQAATDQAQTVFNNEETDSVAVGEVLEKLISEILKARLMGDVDMNGKVETADSSKILKSVAELEELTKDQRKVADVNGDGNSDSTDAAAILQYAAEKITLQSFSRSMLSDYFNIHLS